MQGTKAPLEELTEKGGYYMPRMLGTTTYEALDLEYLETLMTLQEPDMVAAQIKSAIRAVTCGITIKRNGVKVGVSYLSCDGGQVFLHGYKDYSARFHIKGSIDAGKELCEVAKKGGYKHILCVFKRKRKDLAFLAKAVGFTKQLEFKDADIYKMQLRTIVAEGD